MGPGGGGGGREGIYLLFFYEETVVRLWESRGDKQNTKQ